MHRLAPNNDLLLTSNAQEIHIVDGMCLYFFFLDDMLYVLSIYQMYRGVCLSVMDELRNGVEQAANCFGSGFLRPDAGNTELRQNLLEEPGLANEMQRQIMRFIYQLIFIFVTEERDILLEKSTDAMNKEQINGIKQARLKYNAMYSTSRIRSTLHLDELENDFDGYQEIKAIISGLRYGNKKLALPALGSFLFSENSTPLLDPLVLLNDDYLMGLKKLCLHLRGKKNHTVDWKMLNEKELGSINESLLELHPVINIEQNTFNLQYLEGNDRKSSGSYYTPTHLVDHIISTTIDPLLEEIKLEVEGKYLGKEVSDETIKKDQIDAILNNLIVCDPACGSGHFLLAALDRIAQELAQIQCGIEKPDSGTVQDWKRKVASRCIYGVDLNSTAVELCKVTIWMDTYDGTRPLSFLDSHIRCGNSLLGQHIDDVGIISNDAIPRAWVKEKKENKKHNELTMNNRDVSSWSGISIKSVLMGIAKKQSRINSMGEKSLSQVTKKSSEYNQSLDSPQRMWAKELLDSTRAMWWWPDPELDELQRRKPSPPVPLGSRDIEDYAIWLAHQHKIAKEIFVSNSPIRSIGNKDQYQLIREVTAKIAKQQQFFHWELEFAEVFFPQHSDNSNGGFSVMLGNPPFLGGSKISTHSSVETANFIRKKYDGGAKADLISYFVRQSFDYLRPEGVFGLVSTNALRSGESRLCGLYPILELKQQPSQDSSDSQYYQAYVSDVSRNIEWSGDAAVTVDLLTIKKTDIKLNAKHPVAILDGKPVSTRISSRLNLRTDSNPMKLEFNQDISQRGVNPRGKFQISREQHDIFIASNPACKKVLKPWVSGDDINKDGSASKYIIDLNGLVEEEVRKYPQICDYVEQHIKTYRDDLKDAKEYVRLKERWWEWEFTAPSVANWFENHDIIYAKSRHSTRWIISEIPRGAILSEGTFSFFFDQLEYFVVLQSVLHEDWSREFGSTLGSEGHRYTNSCILNFPFPTESTDESRVHARKIGRKYLDLRKEICNTRDCSISELQDFMHNPEIQDKDILDYRCATIELDNAALALYSIESGELIRDFQQSSSKTKFWPPQHLVESLFSNLLAKNNLTYQKRQ